MAATRGGREAEDGVATGLATARLRPEDIVSEPFPHAVLHDAIEPGLYAALAREMPPLEVLVKGRPFASNERLNFSAASIGMSPAVSPAWKAFIQAHVNQPFLDEIVRLFGPHIRAAYPDFERFFRPLPALRAGVRGADDYGFSDVLLDAQIAVNTPVAGAATSVRGPHVDMPEKLFVGLLYFRRDGDESEGGDLEFYRAGGSASAATRDVGIGRIDCVKRVRYAANTLVLMLNTPWSLHGVSPRAPTAHPRLFVNFIGQVGGPLFQAEAGRARRLLRRIGMAP
jgi:hypothetical protein